MKKECAIVQDMLVLYEDDCLQEESRKMVEDHIADRIRSSDTEKCVSNYEKNKKANNIESSYRYRIDCGSYNRWTCFLQPYNG